MEIFIGISTCNANDIDRNIGPRNILCIVTSSRVIGFSKHSGSNCDRSSSIVKGLEGPTKTRVPVITWQDHHYVSTPIRSEQGGRRGVRMARGSGKG